MGEEIPTIRSFLVGGRTGLNSVAFPGVRAGEIETLGLVAEPDGVAAFFFLLRRLKVGRDPARWSFHFQAFLLEIGENNLVSLLLHCRCHGRLGNVVCRDAVLEAPIGC